MKPRPGLLGPALLLLLAACGGQRASGPVPHEAYVWQRQWTSAVRAAIAETSPLSGLVVLGAEVDFRRQPVRVARVTLDPSLRGRPVGVALRVHTFPGRFADSPEAVRLVAGLSRGLVQEARRAGIPLSEVQLDYDCPDSRLEDYPTLIAAVRKETAPVPVTITALPSWLRRQEAFGGLVAAADGYVLQVHSLSPPAGPDAPDTPLTICDPEAARQAVEKAARFRQPFRVALPTYGYSVAFDARGRRAGVSAEGPPLLPPPGGSLRTVRSDPAAMAALVDAWTEDRPAELAGVIWYRLPLESDRLNWPAATFRAVLAGRTPRVEVAAEVRRPEPGLFEIDLVNRGEAEAPWPAWVRVRWRHPRTHAADGLADYRIARTAPREIQLARAFPDGAPGRPGDRRTVAWLRLAPASGDDPDRGGEEIAVELAPMPQPSKP